MYLSEFYVNRILLASHCGGSNVQKNGFLRINETMGQGEEFGYSSCSVRNSCNLERIK